MSKDPDDVYREHGPDALLRAVAGARPFLATIIDEAAGLEAEQALRLARPYLAAEQDPVRRALYEERLAQALALAPSTVHAAAAPVEEPRRIRDHAADVVALLDDPSRADELSRSPDLDVRAVATAIAVDVDMGETPRAALAFAPLKERLARHIFRRWICVVHR